MTMRDNMSNFTTEIKAFCDRKCTAADEALARFSELWDTNPREAMLRADAVFEAAAGREVAARIQNLLRWAVDHDYTDEQVEADIGKMIQDALISAAEYTPSTSPSVNAENAAEARVWAKLARAMAWGDLGSYLKCGGKL